MRSRRSDGAERRGEERRGEEGRGGGGGGGGVGQREFVGMDPLDLGKADEGWTWPDSEDLIYLCYFLVECL